MDYIELARTSTILGIIFMRREVKTEDWREILDGMKANHWNDWIIKEVNGVIKIVSKIVQHSDIILHFSG